MGLTMVQRMFKIEHLKKILQYTTDPEQKRIITIELNKLIDDQLDRSYSIGKIYII